MTRAGPGKLLSEPSPMNPAQPNERPGLTQRRPNPLEGLEALSKSLVALPGGSYLNTYLNTFARGSQRIFFPFVMRGASKILGTCLEDNGWSGDWRKYKNDFAIFHIHTSLPLVSRGSRRTKLRAIHTLCHSAPYLIQVMRNTLLAGGRT